MIVVACVLASCDSPETRVVPVEAGKPSIEYAERWVQGQPTDVLLRWPNASDCWDDWFCRVPPVPLTVESVTCDGCAILVDPSGVATEGPAVVTAIATTDGPIAIHADLRFDATGQRASVTGSATGDHEVGLEATCMLADISGQPPGYPGLIGTSLLRPCGATRNATDAVLIVPRIRTFHGVATFPFCLYECFAGAGPHLRPRSELVVSPVPSSWTLDYFGKIDHNAFAVMPNGMAEQTVTVRTTLATGEVVATSVSIPPQV